MNSGREPVPSALAHKLSQIATATGCWNLHKLGIRNTYMKGLHPICPLGLGRRVVGRAFTVRYVPFREDIDGLLTPETRLTQPYRRAIEMLREGDVLVIDALGNLEAGVIGDILAARMKYLGVVAVVVDGAVRDSPFIAEVGLPTFVKGLHPAAHERALMSVDFDVPIQCGGALVMPNDIILADDEGVVVIPPTHAEKLAQVAFEQEQQELFIRDKISQGLSLMQAYPPNVAVLAEYDEYRRARGG